MMVLVAVLYAPPMYLGVIAGIERSEVRLNLFLVVIVLAYIIYRYVEPLFKG